MTFQERIDSMREQSRTKLLGKIFNHLKVIEFDHERYVQTPTYAKYKYYWKCECLRCGSITIVEATDLCSGHTTSCGCVNRDNITTGLHTTHGYAYHRLYNVYSSMIDRCYNPNCKSYKRYGARGIYVCDEWQRQNNTGKRGVVNFIEWAYSNGYYDQPKDTSRRDILTIERKDVNGPYSPDNCIWIAGKDQAKNTRNNHKIWYKDAWYNIADLKDIEPTIGFIANRLKAKWPESAISMALMNPELGLHRDNGIYKDKDDFVVLIPKIKKD